MKTKLSCNTGARVTVPVITLGPLYFIVVLQGSGNYSLAIFRMWNLFDCLFLTFMIGSDSILTPIAIALPFEINDILNPFLVPFYSCRAGRVNGILPLSFPIFTINHAFVIILAILYSFAAVGTHFISIEASGDIPFSVYLVVGLQLPIASMT